MSDISEDQKLRLIIIQCSGYESYNQLKQNLVVGHLCQLPPELKKHLYDHFYSIVKMPKDY